MDDTPREREERAGKRLRRVVPRSSHGSWEPPPDRADPVETVAAENAGRVRALVPLRWARMVESPLGFLRGAAGVMAADLASTPSTGVHVQVCGDAHLANFGVFASPERRLLFDVTDFDETTSGPWEWDVKRLAASVVVAGRQSGLRPGRQRQAALDATRAYRRHMGRYAAMGTLQVWYERVDAKAALDAVGRPRQVRANFAAAERHTPQAALATMTVREGRHGRCIADHPPTVTHEGVEAQRGLVDAAFDRYCTTLEDDRRVLFERFELVDVAFKVVGVGSVGTRCFVALFLSDTGDPLFLQLKEARTSCVAPFVPRRRAHASVAAEARRQPAAQPRARARRVVSGQRLMQAASDIFLGWAALDGVEYYVRQLRDMKGAVDSTSLAPRALTDYAELCGWALARAHARSGAAARIAGYLGRGPVFDEAVADFAVSYADQTERDHARAVDAAATGEIEVADTP
jgi:uncharacterized protein (DUF2252 family)